MAKTGANTKSRSDPPPPRKRRAIAAVTTRSTTISQLPEDIICEILLRISDIKSLVRCKQVCKTWRNLILQPYFAKLHLSRGSLPLSLILYRPPDGFTNPAHFGILELEDIFRLRRPNATVKFKSEIYIPYGGQRGGLIGACNGLVCLHVNKDIVVCNPILQGRHFVLPKIPKLAQTFSIRFGFGFSPLSDEYKVLRGTVTCDNHLYYLTLHIFTLGKDDTWRSVGEHNGQAFPPFYAGDDFVFANGALHWLGSGLAPKFLCCFDVESEELGNLSLPCHIGGVSHRGVLDGHIGGVSLLGVLDGFLYLGVLHSSHVIVWVMEDYIHKGAWKLKWDINLPGVCVVAKSVRPIKNLKDGTILMIFDNKSLLSYNPKTRGTIRITYRRVGFWTAAVAHRPSFLCPPWLLYLNGNG